MVEKIRMNVYETLELEYLVEQINDDTISITGEPTSGSSSIDYIATQKGVFNPSETGIHKLDINGQTVEIEVYDIPDSGNLHARYDATQLSLSDGDSVTSWADETSNGYDLTGSGPTFSSPAINGNPAVSFDGTDDRMETSSWSTISQPFSVYAVISRSGSGAGYEPIFDQKSSGQSDRAIMATNSNGSWALWASNFVEGGSPDLNNHIFDGVYDGASSTGELDGSQVLSGDVGGNSLGSMSIGSDAGSGSGDQYNGVIGEMLFYSTGHNSTTRSDVQSYLSDKWGITV